MEEFETKIKELDLEIQEQKICHHPDQKFCIYKSECFCCDPLDTKIYKRTACQECFEGNLVSLLHGGHYRSLVVFNSDKKLSRYDQMLETKEQRYINFINDKIEDLSTDQLKKLVESLR